MLHAVLLVVWAGQQGSIAAEVDGACNACACMLA